MTIIQNIPLADIKHVLGYAVKNRRGYRHDINFIDGKAGRTIDKFVEAGLVHNGQTYQHQTWSITGLGDQYYRNLFGDFDYYRKRVSGFLSKLFRQD